MTTTLNKIHDNDPCEDGWHTLLDSLNATQPDDTPVSIKHIIQSNGLSDALWALRAVDGHDREKRLFTAWCAEQVLHIYENAYPADNRPRAAIKAAMDYANGLIDVAALAAAREAAHDAAWAAAWAATRAAEQQTAADAAWAATRAAEQQTAADAALDAANDAARAAARQTAADAAWIATRAAQKAELIRVCECVEQGVDPYPTNPA